MDVYRLFRRALLATGFMNRFGAALLAPLWLAGDLPARAALAGSADSAFAAVFTYRLWSTRTQPAP